MAKPKKEVVYQADAGKSDYSDSYGTQTSYKKTKKDSSGKGESTASADLTTGKGNVLPEFELAVTKMYGSPARMDTVDPTTGQVLPTGMGQGPTNVGNANTAQTLQNQADAEAVKANRAGVPSRSASSISQTPMTMQGNFKNNSMAHASRMFGNVANPVPSPSQFNKGVPIKAKGNPEIKGTVLPELEVNYTPKITSGKTTDMTTGAERDSTAKEKASQEKELQSKGDGRTTTSYTNKDGKKVKLKQSTKVSF